MFQPEGSARAKGRSWERAWHGRGIARRPAWLEGVERVEGGELVADELREEMGARSYRALQSTWALPLSTMSAPENFEGRSDII